LLLPAWFGWHTSLEVKLAIAAIALGSLQLIHRR
jgi:hypothetical protein